MKETPEQKSKRLLGEKSDLMRSRVYTRKEIKVTHGYLKWFENPLTMLGALAVIFIIILIVAIAKV